MGAVDRQGAEGCIPKALNADTVWVARFGDKDWRHHLNRAAQRHKFEATLSPRLDREIEKINRVIDLEAERDRRRPEIKHEEPTPEQTGDSRLLGGPMSISSPWDDDPEPPSAA